MNVLFSKNIAAVAYHATFEFQKRRCPTSQISRTSGFRRQKRLKRYSESSQFLVYRDTHQIVREVYRTISATEMVTISPGTRPRTEYDHGKDMMAMQIYSEKSKAAV